MYFASFHAMEHLFFVLVEQQQKGIEKLDCKG